MKTRVPVLVGIALCMLVGTAWSAPTAEQNCRSKRQKAAAQYVSCQHKALAGYWLRLDLEKYNSALRKCIVKYEKAWTKLQKIEAAPCNKPSRFEDNGDGTVVDHLTGLIWEKKGSSGGIQGKDTEFSWTSATGNPDGTAYTSFLATLNAGSGLAGAKDWRLPTVIELMSIFRLESKSPYSCAAVPCVDDAFGPTGSGLHWTSTTLQDDSTRAWWVLFAGAVAPGGKIIDSSVRAVRGGL